MTRRAKIVCTLGPASASPAGIRALVDAGMDVARLNFAHGTREEHAAAYARVREASDDSGRAVGILADLQGPKVRLGRFEGGQAELETGAEFRITTEPILGDRDRASTDYPDLARDARPGDKLLLDDGRVRLEVLTVEGPEVRCRVEQGGPVGDRKGIHLPGARVGLSALTERDRQDLRFALGLRVDLVALSFVRGPEDAVAVSAAMADAGATLPVIAKLEKPEAVDRLEAVLEAFDGLMVARGDLGVEAPLEEVPLIQKRAVQLARERGKPVVVATEMLESMVHRPRPTRAEASDVANAVLDGADALMLSAESAIGAHPVESVATMSRLIVAAERQGLATLPPIEDRAPESPEAIGRAAVRVAEDLGARALVAFTQSGRTARLVARHRNPMPLLAFTTSQAVRSQLALVWGVETFVVPTVDSTDQMVALVERAMLDLGRARPGERVVIVAGTPPGAPGSTNTLRVHRLGGGSRA